MWKMIPLVEFPELVQHMRPTSMKYSQISAHVGNIREKANGADVHLFMPLLRKYALLYQDGLEDGLFQLQGHTEFAS